MNEFYGTEVIITGEVKYIGQDEDPITNPWFIAYVNALKKSYQLERLSEKTR